MPTLISQNNSYNNTNLSMINGNNNNSVANPLKVSNGLNTNNNTNSNTNSNNNSGVNNTNNNCVIINGNINKINGCVVDMTNLIRYTSTNNNMNIGNSNFNGELLVDDRWMLGNIVILKGDTQNDNNIKDQLMT